MDASTLAATRPDKSFTVTDRMARNLGWFSIGLGLAELVAPGKIGRAVGLQGQEKVLRAYGAREIGAGLGALSIDPTPFIWSRVAGDLLDLGTLAQGLKGQGETKRNAAIAMGAVAAITLIDVAVALSLGKERARERGETRDYSDRSGFPGGVAKARGAARKNEEKAVPAREMEVANELSVLRRKPEPSGTSGATGFRPSPEHTSHFPNEKAPAIAGAFHALETARECGSPGLIRTGGRPINSRMLYR